LQYQFQRDGGSTSTLADKQRRAYFRLRYPATARPKLLTQEGRRYEVCEIFEAGRLFTVPEGETLPFDTDVFGILDLSDGALLIEGRLLRLDGGEAVVVLSAGVDFHSMAAQQKRLIRKYPGLFGHPDVLFRKLSYCAQD
jgi:hypothetical protein